MVNIYSSFLRKYIYINLYKHSLGGGGGEFLQKQMQVSINNNNNKCLQSFWHSHSL